MSHPLSVDDDGSGLSLGDLHISERNEVRKRSISVSSSGSESSTSPGWRANDPYRLRHRSGQGESSATELQSSRPTLAAALGKEGAPQSAVDNDENMSSASSTSSSTFDKASGHVIEVATPEVRPAVSVWGTSGQSARAVDDAALHNRASMAQRPLPVGVPPPATTLSPEHLLFTVNQTLAAHPQQMRSTDDVARTLLPTGFTFSLRDPDRNTQHLIDSASISATVGAARYLENFLRHGHPPVAQLCRNFVRFFSGTSECGGCISGTACELVHCRTLPPSKTSAAADGERPTGGAASPDSSHSAHSSASVAAAVVTAPQQAAAVALATPSHSGSEPLPAGVVISVWPPNNANAQPQRIPSEYILRTLGGSNIYQVMLKLTQDREAKLLELQLSGGRGPPPLPVKQPHGLKPRHCAHFQYKKMCNLGAECNFIHSLVPMLSQQQQQTAPPQHQHPQDRSGFAPPPPPPPPPAPVVAQLRPAAMQFAPSTHPINTSTMPMQHAQPTYVTVTSAAAHHHSQHNATYTHVPLSQAGPQYHATAFALPQQVHSPSLYSHPGVAGGGAPSSAFLHQAHMTTAVQPTMAPSGFASGYSVATVDARTQAVVRSDAASEQLRLLLLQHGFSTVPPDALFQSGPR